jgi:hypothetical protein
MALTPNDINALKRAIEWGEGYQRREPQIVVFPNPMPDEGTPDWIELATRLASIAQCATLGLRPWEVEPCHASDVVHSGWGGKPQEVALRRKLIGLGLSRFEPDPLRAIAMAEERQTGP